MIIISRCSRVAHWRWAVEAGPRMLPLAYITITSIGYVFVAVQSGKTPQSTHTGRTCSEEPPLAVGPLAVP